MPHVGIKSVPVALIPLVDCERANQQFQKIDLKEKVHPSHLKRIHIQRSQIRSKLGPTWPLPRGTKDTEIDR